MNKICGYNCEHNKGGICQITYCDKIGKMTTTTQEPVVLTRWIDPTIEEYKKEIERLKERIEYLERSNNRREDEILELRKENADLDNIINKLEESLKDDKEEYNKDLDLETKELYNEYWRGYSICADKNLDYLQELKGEDKE